MKKYLLSLKDNIYKRLVESVRFFGFTTVRKVQLLNGRLIEVASSGGKLAVVEPSAYVKLEKKYNVISRKDLEKIVANEKSYLSPFSNSYALYRLQEQSEGAWDVVFYFIDLDSFPDLTSYPFIVVGEDILLSTTQEELIPSVTSSPIGDIVIERNRGKLVSTVVTSEGALKRKIISQGEEDSLKRNELDVPETLSRLSRYVLSFSWIGLKGTVNSGYFEENKPKVTLSKRHGLMAVIAVVAVIVLESLYLLGTEVYIERARAQTAAPLNDYLSLKSEYGEKLDTYNKKAALLHQRTNVSSIPLVLSELSEVVTLDVDRVDYMQGEIRVIGQSDDIQGLMSFLSGQQNITGLEFISPITQGKNNMDRFAIKFEFADE